MEKGSYGARKEMREGEDEGARERGNWRTRGRGDEGESLGICPDSAVPVLYFFAPHLLCRSCSTSALHLLCRSGAQSAGSPPGYRARAARRRTAFPRCTL